jgi:hypothetical protein
LPAHLQLGLEDQSLGQPNGMAVDANEMIFLKIEEKSREKALTR